MVNKKILILVFSFLILTPLLSNQRVEAASTKQRVYDFAQLLSPDQVEELERLSAKHSKKRKIDIIILTSKDANGKDIIEYMEDFYDDHGLGYDKPYGNTVMLTLDMGERDVHVGGFYKGEKFLDDKRSDLVRNEVTPQLSCGDYYGAFSTYIKTTSKYMGFRPGVNPNSPLFNTWLQLLASLFVGGAIVGTMASRSQARMSVHEGTYRDPSHSRIIERRDDYIRTTTTKTRKPSNNSSGSSGGGFTGGSGGGVSRGGHSHSGSRGKF